MTFPSPHGEPPPRHLDRFRFAELLGTGGSSVVYAARDRALDRRVAVKLPRDDVRPLSWIRRARLLREAQALARVRHPHVVAVLDAVVADDLACVVLAPIAGAPAHGQALSPRRVAAVGLQIAAALTACHAARVVHRDVSPHNILVDRHGRATLIDFGLARALDPRPDDQPDDFLALPLSPAGRAAGTRPYAAPELLRGGVRGPGRGSVRAVRPPCWPASPAAARRRCSACSTAACPNSQTSATRTCTPSPWPCARWPSRRTGRCPGTPRPRSRTATSRAASARAPSS
jgi:serine/threonine protein kinase